MRLKSGTIYSLLACAVGLLGIAGGYDFFRLVDTTREIENIRQVMIDMLICRRHEKDFLTRLDTSYIQKHDQSYRKLVKAAETLEDRTSVSITPLLERYRAAFEAVVEGTVEIGLTEEEGLRGTLRKAIHEVEGTLNATGEKDLLVLMLLCRRYEKDFLLRKTVLSVERFDRSVDALLEAVGKSQPTVDPSRLSEGIRYYRASFDNLAALVTKVGLDKDSGLRGEMRRAIHEAESTIITLDELAQVDLDQNLVRTIVLGVLIAVIVAISLTLLIKISKVNAALNSEIARRVEAEQSLVRANETLEQVVESRTSELVVAKEKAEKALERAEEAGRAKSAFLANISHEIRTPLNAITGFSELLGQTLVESQQKDHLKNIQDSSRTLLQLINRILDFSRFESEEIELHASPVDLLSVFGELQDHYGPHAAEKDLELLVDLDPGLPSVVLLDSERFQQILESLTDNAVKFTAVGHIAISVRATASSAEPRTVDLSFDIQDTGVGIPEGQVEEIFKAFTQKTGQSINEYGGTGMGLALTRRLVQAMNGTIRVKSQVGVGSTFHVLLSSVAVKGTETVGDALNRQGAGGGDADTVSEVAGGQDTWSPADLNKQVRTRLPELGRILEERATACEELSQTQTINDVEAFAAEMKQLATHFEYPPLDQWAGTLAEQVAAFDIDRMSESLKGYPEVLAGLRNLSVV